MFWPRGAEQPPTTPLWQGEVSAVIAKGQVDPSLALQPPKFKAFDPCLPYKSAAVAKPGEGY